MTEPATAPAADPDLPCYHPDFDAVVAVARVGEGDDNNPTPGMPKYFVAEVQVKCGSCGERFKFEGLPAGMSYASPAVSVDGFELRAPIRPEQAPPAYPRRAGGEVIGFSIDLHRRGDSGQP